MLTKYLKFAYGFGVEIKAKASIFDLCQIISSCTYFVLLEENA